MAEQPTEEVWAYSAYGAKTGKPMVELRFRGQSVTISPADARRLALNILNAAEGANTDAWLVDFYHRRQGMPMERVAGLIQERRNWRDTREEADDV